MAPGFKPTISLTSVVSNNYYTRAPTQFFLFTLIPASFLFNAKDVLKKMK